MPVVLLLEDEALIAIDVEMTLNSAGFSVVKFARCDEAETWLADNSPDVAIIDVALSDGVCVNAAQTLAQRGIPFVVHSGDPATAEAKHPVFQAGKWFNKPSSVEKLAAEVSRLASIRA